MYRRTAKRKPDQTDVTPSLFLATKRQKTDDPNDIPEVSELTTGYNDPIQSEESEYKLS